VAPTLSRLRLAGAGRAPNARRSRVRFCFRRAAEHSSHPRHHMAMRHR
jgi:hypothetical protein